MNHHHCSCDHKRLSFCSRCKVPHCMDCGKEWQEKSAFGHYYYPYGYPYVGGNTTTTPQITWTTSVSNDPFGNTQAQTPLESWQKGLQGSGPIAQQGCDHAN